MWAHGIRGRMKAYKGIRVECEIYVEGKIYMFSFYCESESHYDVVLGRE